MRDGEQPFDEIVWSGELPPRRDEPAGWLVEIPRPKWWPRWLVSLMGPKIEVVRNPNYRRRPAASNAAGSAPGEGGE